MVDTENPPLRLLSINPKAKIIIILQLLPYNVTIQRMPAQFLFLMVISIMSLV